MTTTSAPHRTVLLKEAVDALVVRPGGCYVDGTFGRGGHSREILRRLEPEGRLIGIDKDPQAIAAGEQLAGDDPRFQVVRASFADTRAVVAAAGHKQVDGLLLDLGVSSPQLDQAERGFSFLRDGALDMRMDPQRGESAAQWLARAKEADIARVLKEFGEERFAKRMARAIVTERAVEPIATTKRLADVVAAAHPAWEKGKHPATRAFQAIRIFINNELDDLQRFLDAAVDLLADGGRLVVISFHSLEDRIVKRFIQRQQRGEKVPAYIPVTAADQQPRLRAVGKALRAGSDEVEENLRARSAIMRVAEKPVAP